MPKKATKKRGKAKTAKRSVKKTTKKRVKKVVKKAATKVKKSAKKAVKKAKKRTITKKVVNAPQGQEFFLLNGKKVKNYKELAKVMEHLEDHVFRHHVNAEKNDFANWIEYVFKDIALARRIAGAKDKDKIELILHRRVVRHK